MPLLPWQHNGHDEEYRDGRRYPPTQDHILAREVRDGVLVLKDHTLVAAIGIQPLDLSLLAPEEREAKLMQYEEALKEIRFPFQIIVGTKPQQVDAYMAYLEECAQLRQKEGRHRLADLARGQALIIRNVARRATAQLRHFLIALAYDDPAIVAQRATRRVSELTAEQFGRGQQELSKRASHLILCLQRIGLEAWRLDEREITAELANFYHPRLPRQEAVGDEYFTTSRLPRNGDNPL